MARTLLATFTPEKIAAIRVEVCDWLKGNGLDANVIAQVSIYTPTSGDVTTYLVDGDGKPYRDPEDSTSVVCRIDTVWFTVPVPQHLIDHVRDREQETTP